MGKLDALWQYQQAELALDALENKVKATPARAKLNKLHSFLTEQQAQISSIQKQMDARQAALAKLSAQFEELAHKYELEVSEFAAMENDPECTAAEMTESRKALEALQDQLGLAKRDIFDTFHWVEKTTADYKDRFTKAGHAKKDYDAARIACEEELAAAQPEIDAARAEAEKQKALVEPALLTRYAAVKTHHTVPMATVENNQCSGCRMSLPTVVVKKVASGTGPVECENCGRILYTPRA
ncbi:MAG: C4-type zinc ribbon domain-containing protein [Christensenellaceae bacterium]|jgi:predicted  nucleic acid-binding Zn-ribbon protein|nr:C4-type zinc ribbon domain-containing protein [Christensenellaceae bacterium]